MPSQRGSLTLAGSGVASIGQLTLQTIGAIESADTVCVALNDPVTEAFIRKKNPNVYDLCQLFDDNKPRLESYIQMVEVLLNKVRQGQDVVGLFFGHPGICVTPAHRALKIAQKEGFRVRMLPSISTPDALMADLGIDPATTGLQYISPNDILDRTRNLDPASNVLIPQAGIVGNEQFKFHQMENPLFGQLVDRLEEAYSKDQEIVNYIPAMLPTDEPSIERCKISDLRKQGVKNKIIPDSTLFIPARRDQTISPFDSAEGKKVHRAAISALSSHQPGKNYSPFKESAALTEALERLALDPKELDAYKANRQAWINENGRGLTEEERNALSTGRGIRQLLSEGPIAEYRVAPMGLPLRALAD